jgi:hypothetical protein
MIVIQPSKTADTRSCDFSKVTEQQLFESSKQHINDVRKGFDLFIAIMNDAAMAHDFDKLTGIKWFHADFITGFKQTGWWDNHRIVNRHHLLQADGVPKNVNLIDVLDMIIDCVMAGTGRTGTVYPVEISDDVLRAAFNNTVELLKNNVRVEVLAAQTKG